MELRSGHTRGTTTSLGPSETGARPLLTYHQSVGTTEGQSNTPDVVAERLQRGQVMLDSALIRQLRQGRLMSQRDLANDCWRRNIPLSLNTIKRAELGRPVRYRIAREFARCFEVPVTQVLRV